MEKASQRRLGRLGKWRAQGWSGIGKRRQGKAGTAVGRNAGGRTGTLAPAASLVLLRGRGGQVLSMGASYDAE